jgi:hypothetical protein
MLRAKSTFYFHIFRAPLHMWVRKPGPTIARRGTWPIPVPQKTSAKSAHQIKKDTRKLLVRECLFPVILVGAGGFEPCANYFVSKFQFLYEPKNRVFKRVFRCLRSNLQHIRFYILAVNTTTIFYFLFCGES